MIGKYKVSYRGGIASLPKAKIGTILLHVLDDRFEFEPTTGSKKFWEELVLPYSEVSEVEAVDRTVSTFEGLMGGLDSRQLNQKNVLVFSHSDGQQLRVEMMTGVTVMGQAKKCVEFLDQIVANGIRSQFAAVPSEEPLPSGAASSPTSELLQLAELHASGALSDQEFAAAKSRLLG